MKQTALILGFLVMLFSVLVAFILGMLHGETIQIERCTEILKELGELIEGRT